MFHSVSESDSQYAIHNAVQSNDVDLLRKLISSGYHVNSCDDDLVQPLHIACFKGHLECVKILLENGAEVNARNIDCATPLCDAASSGHVECMELLIKHGAHVNPPLLLTSPLHEATIRDQWKAVDLLIQAGAILNSSDCHFGTPLHVTAFQGGIKSAEVLLRAGAHVNAIKNHKTPLHDAARRDDYNFIHLLLEFGANPSSRDNNGRKPVDLVPHSESLCRELLLKWETNALPLKHTCRLRIRCALGPSRLNFIYQLEMPRLLQEYLEFR